MPFHFLQLLLIKSIPTLWILTINVAALGIMSIEPRRDNPGWRAGHVSPPLLHALCLQALLGLHGGKLSHRMYILQAFHKSLITLLEP